MSFTKSISISSLFAFALLTLPACSPKEKLPSGLDEFATTFRAANESNTIKLMLKLYNLEEADERTIRMLKGALLNEHRLPIAKITFEPLTGAPEENICFERKGVAYGPSHEPEYRMSVYHNTEDGFTSRYTIGRVQSGKWKILCSKPLPEPHF